MVECIVGKKGKGKTKHLLERVRLSLTHSKGTLVYLDKNKQHIYELNNKIRFINVSDFLIDNSDMFLGFICGILSQDHDVEIMFLDSFLTIANTKADALVNILEKMDAISHSFHVDFVLSISADLDELPEEIYDKVSISL